MDVRIVSNAEAVKGAFGEASVRALEVCGLIAEGYAKKLCGGFKHPTGNLRDSITHAVADSENAVYIGTDVEYAPYVELGTGKYYPGGRPTPWAYEDEKGETHWTAGNKAQPYLKPAIADHADTYKSIIKSELTKR